MTQLTVYFVLPSTHGTIGNFRRIHVYIDGAGLDPRTLPRKAVLRLRRLLEVIQSNENLMAVDLTCSDGNPAIHILALPYLSSVEWLNLIGNSDRKLSYISFSSSPFRDSNASNG